MTRAFCEAVLALLLAATLSSCGGKGPNSAVDIDDVDGEGPVVPKEDARPKAERPPMNPAAAQAYTSGMSAFAAGDIAGAETQFRSALASDPKAHQAHYALGATLERKGRVEDAREAYEESLRLVPDFEPPIVAVTSLLLRESRAGQAETFLNRLLSKVPHSAAAMAALAEVKSVQKDSPAAQRLAQQALKTDPDYRPAMVVLARDHYRARRLDLALYALTAILDGYGAENPPRDPNNGEARLIRALIYREQGRRKAAIDDLQRVVQLRPDLVEARVNLATYLLEAGNAAQAVPVLEAALAYEPSNVWVHLNLGDGYRLQGRPSEAITQLDWVVQAAPDLAQAHYNLGLVYLFSKVPNMSELQSVQKSIQEFETYLRMKPRTAKGSGDDAEDLLARAKTKKSIIEAMAGSAPADSGSMAPPTSGDTGSGDTASGDTGGAQ